MVITVQQEDTREEQEGPVSSNTVTQSSCWGSKAMSPFLSPSLLLLQPLLLPLAKQQERSRRSRSRTVAVASSLATATPLSSGDSRVAQEAGGAVFKSSSVP